MGLSIQISDEKEVVRLLIELAKTGFPHSIKGEIMGLREDVKTLLVSEAAQGSQLTELKTAVDTVFDVVDAKLKAAEDKAAALQAEIDALAETGTDVTALQAAHDEQDTAIAGIRAAVDARLPVPTPDGGVSTGAELGQSITTRSDR